MPPFRLACLAYLSIAMPGTTLGLLWPSMRHTLHEPVDALGILLIFGVIASVISSAATGRILTRVTFGPLLTLGTMLVSAALVLQALAPSLWVLAAGVVLFSFGFGAIDAGLNTYAAGRFGPRQINWMHAAYGVGATIGPLVITTLLGVGLGWRWTYAIFAVVIAVISLVFAAARHHWAPPTEPQIRLAPAAESNEKARTATVLSALTFSAVECGIESGAGVWSYIFLTSGRGLSHTVAGVAVAAYWAMMVVGRTVFGPIAERNGSSRVLSGAVVGVALGAALMTIPGPSVLAVAGMMVLGLAAAPVFPLLILATLGSANAEKTAHTVGLQVAASTVGSAVLPGGIGVAIGAFSANVLGPCLLVLSLAMCGVYGFLARSTRPKTA